MTKHQARELADMFKEAFPELYGRPCRFCVYPAGDVTFWYLIPRGPRGGLKRRERLAWATDGMVFITCRTGDIVMEEVRLGGSPDYRTFVVLPHIEDLSGLRPPRKWEFTLEEKLASARLLRDFLLEHRGPLVELREAVDTVAWLRKRVG